HFVALVDQLREGALGDRDEGQLVGHLEHRKGTLAGRGHERRGKPLVGEAGAEAEARDVVVGESLDQLALHLRPRQLQAGRQQQLAAAQPRRGVGQLGRVHPANVRLGGLVAAGQLEPELLDQALDSELHCSIRSPAAASTGRSTASISSNCSSPAISGGDSCTIGSPRSSVRQISPRPSRLPERKPRRSTSDSWSSKVSFVALSLTSSIAWKYPAPRTSPTIGRSRKPSRIP